MSDQQDAPLPEKLTPEQVHAAAIADGYVEYSEGFFDCKFYDLLDPEQLFNTDPDEAIEMVIDEMSNGPKETPAELHARVKERFGEFFVVTGYKNLVLGANEPDPDSILEDVLTSLDDNGYGGEDMTEPNERMKEAARAFVAVMREEYKPWACEEAGTAKVHVDTWLDRHSDALS